MNAVRGLFGGSRTDIELERWKRLQACGYKYVSAGAAETGNEHYVPKGQALRPELGADFVGFDTEGRWVNNRWSISHDERDLTGRDIAGYAALPERFGNAWIEIPEEVRLAIADKELELGLVREHHGTLDVIFSPDLVAFAQDVVRSGVPGTKDTEVAAGTDNSSAVADAPTGVEA